MIYFRANWLTRAYASAVDVNSVATRLRADETRLVCVTTVDGTEVLEGGIWALLESVLLPDVATVVVARDCDRETRELLAAHPAVALVVATGRASLSAARNVGLSAALPLLRDDVLLAFPDDDCRYAPGTLARVLAKSVESYQEVVVGCYGPSPREVNRDRFPAEEKVLGVADLVGWVSSVTLYVPSKMVRAVGEFDVRLGVGTALPACEDNDFFLRLARAGARFRYDPEIVVLHPYRQGRPSQAVAARMFLIFKHADRFPLLYYHLLRLLASSLIRRGTKSYLAASRELFAHYVLARKTLRLEVEAGV